MPTHTSGQKTKLMLSQSLRKLMKTKALDKIKIREIVEDCGVNRQTFYYHFQDIYELIEWGYEYDAIKIYEQNTDEQEDWVTMINEWYVYLEEHREEIRCVVNSKANMYFRNFIYEGINQLVYLMIDRSSAHMQVDEYYKQFLATFYTCAVSGTVEVWLKDKTPERMSRDELVHMLRITISNNAHNSLRKRERELKEEAQKH